MYKSLLNFSRRQVPFIHRHADLTRPKAILKAICYGTIPTFYVLYKNKTDHFVDMGRR